METTANIAPSSSADRFALRRADSTAMTEISPEMTEMVSGGKTTALVNTIAGLDDFELITFLVIQGAG